MLDFARDGRKLEEDNEGLFDEQVRHTNGKKN